MARQGWLEPTRIGTAAGYALTPKAVRRLDEAGERIYRRQSQSWDGRWHLVVTPPVRDRSSRERVRNGLAFLGYGPLSETTWVAARASRELDGLLAAESVRGERFSAMHDGDSAGLIARAWDLEGLARMYVSWLGDAAALSDTAGPDASDVQAYAVRARLLNEWRKFLFRDPGLPATLLPDDWPGGKAARFFDAEAARLLPAAARFVDRCLDGPQ